MASINPSPKTIIFKCDQHCAVISEKLQNFYEQNEFFDTVLIAGSSVPIQAHRIVLCAFSEYFLELFRGDQSALNGNKVELKEIEASTLKLIIDFMYSGSIELTAETVGGILRTAAFLKIRSLVDSCCKMIEKNLDSSNSLSWFRLGHELSLKILKITALEYIHAIFKEILQEKELPMLSENELKDLLFNENGHVDMEEDVFMAMVAWLNFDKLNRKHLVYQLLSMVRYQVLTPKFIIENRKSVCKTVEDYELICSWLQWHLSPETRSNDHGNCAFMPTMEKEKLAVIRSPLDGKINIETFNPKTNSWSSEMEIHLSINCTAAIVIDSKLIVAGVERGSEFSKSVLCFDLHTFKRIDLPLLKKQRYIWKMANLKGNLCVIGRNTEGLSICIGVFNFTTRKWNDLKPLARSCSRTEIATYNEMLYLLDLDHARLQSYNYSSNEWTFIRIEMQPQTSFGFAALEGFLYIIGGCNSNGTPGEWVKTVKRYNLSTDSWCEKASLPQAIKELKSTVIQNKIIASNCHNTFEYCPDSDKWYTFGKINPKTDWCNFHICNFTVNK